MSDINQEHQLTHQFMTAKEIAATCPSSPTIQTVIRWAIVGVKLRDGTTVKLDSSKIGGRRLFSPDALKEFMEKTK